MFFLLSLLPLQMPLPTDSVPSVKQELDIAKNLPVDEFIDKIVSAFVSFAINLAIAIVVFYVGKFVIRKLYRLVDSIMKRRQVDKSLTTFVLSMIKIVLYFILIVTVIGILGIETSSFIAIFASAGVAIGMALSGTLQNFAGGVLILLLKPYKVGDYIETQGYAGYVREIQIFYTIICTYDNKSIIIPNGGLSTGTINNWTKEDYRRIDWTVSISYGDDVEAARKAILDIFASDDRIVTKYVEDDRQRYATAMKDTSDSDKSAMSDTADAPQTRKRGFFYRLFHHGKRHVQARLESLNEDTLDKYAAIVPRVDRSPQVSLNALGTSSVDLVARAWTRTEFYWSVYYEVNERIYTTLPSHGISFPFPQIDVHLAPQQDA